jgi:hypothetical protein
MMAWSLRWRITVAAGRLGVVVLVAGCAAPSPRVAAIDAPTAGQSTSASQYAIVDCLLPPGLVRQGEGSVRMLPSRPAKLSGRLCAQQGGAQTEGVRAWQALADSGDAEAQTYLGEMYENGIGGAPKDFAKAKALYTSAAERGNARAASNLALLYANGAPGVAADARKAEAAMVQAANNVGVRTIVVEPVISTRTAAASEGTGTNIDLKHFPFGRYHALLIGNSNYANAPPLKSPVFEVDAIGALLERRYGFNVTKLKNATGEQILRKLDDLEQDLGANDNLLVYYTGHGAESASKEGYWIPVDGQGPNSTDGYRTAKWISSSTVREKLSLMKPRHILVVSDSCYSGRFLQFRGVFKPGASVAAAYLDNFNKLYAARSRTALTSGGLAPVLEPNDGSNMSLFAKSFVHFLERNREPIPSVQVFTRIGFEVMTATSALGFPQQPQWGPITGAGHETGDFWFRPQ